MSKFNELVSKYESEMTKLGISFEQTLFEAVAKGLGPSIYNNDSSIVSCTDNEELERIKSNFLIKKLGMSDSSELNDTIKEVCNEMGSSNRNKYRAIFYYLLVKKTGKEFIYS